ncbi:MAG TPA: DUF4244 domain-containing protein [Actinomycetota bacterium]
MFGSLRSRWLRLARAIACRVHCRVEAGVSTTEYTLVILVAASVALLLLNWARGGAIVGFFDTIFQRVVDMFAP